MIVCKIISITQQKASLPFLTMIFPLELVTHPGATSTSTSAGTFYNTGRGGAYMPNLARQHDRHKSDRPRHTRDTLPPMPPDDPDTKHPGFACRIQGPYIFITRSDGEEGLIPECYSDDQWDQVPKFEDGTINYFRLLPQDSHQVRYWKEKLGQELATRVLKLPAALNGTQTYYLANFPEHYALLQHRNGPIHDPRTDVYLYGSGRVTKFRSTKEFLPHLVWIIQKKGDGPRRKCTCCWPHHQKGSKSPVE
jgi:hypothetical protein